MCGRAAGGLLCARSTGSAFGAATTWSTSFSNAAGWSSSKSYWGTISFPDLNGDGRSDVCGRSSGGIQCALSSGTTMLTSSLWTTDYSDAAGWYTNEHNWGTIRHPDLNGDGRADICGRSGGGILCAK